MNILITGATGFVGKNLVDVLSTEPKHQLFLANSTTPVSDLQKWGQEVDICIHLAGYSRTHDEADGYEKNVSYTRFLTTILSPNVPILFASTNAANSHHRYVETKRKEETLLQAYFSKVKIVRFDNLFGKWAAPFYNSVVATFIHGVLENKAFPLFDEHTPKSFLYVDDAIQVIVEWIDQPDYGIAIAKGSYQQTPHDILTMIRQINEDYQRLNTLVYDNPFQQRLAITFMSYVQPTRFFPLSAFRDARGAFLPFSKSASSGQWSINEVEVGAEKGNHYHRIRYEKFILLSGKVTLWLRHRFSDESIQIELDRPYDTYYIPPGYIHKIINQGSQPAVLVMWSSLVFDADHPDTYPATI